MGWPGGVSRTGTLLLTEAGKEHRAGVWTVAAGQGAPPMEHLGPEADRVTLMELATMLRATTGRLHGWLRDQRQIAGIGRRLANEICWTAQISPFASVNKLGDDAIARLHEAVGSCIGTSIDDERTRDHMAKSAVRLAAVHHREGEACPRCGDIIRAVEYNVHGELLRDLPDRRQGAGRQHDLEVLEVALAQMRPSSATASRSSTSSAVELPIRRRENSLMSRPCTIS